ncbi:hypothetical protein KFE25_003707 [Diacronema lutheri]|uniref:Glutathione transferase n=1 Tax=Diacronema lutheri TaxID=2081491 RepID=A0A8J6CB61_DIALT|nr:hypothetical protein KFE25_003707 [Diacronema lutheri]
MPVTLSLTPDYGYVLAAAGVIGITSTYIGAQVMSLRAKCFKSESFTASKAVQAMRDEHKKAFGTDMNNLGYPDMGNGRYAAQLDYASWVMFNNGQRAHYNMVESVGPLVGALLTSGLAAPRLAASLGVCYALGRLLYARGYCSEQGADGRIPGAGLAFLSMLSLYVLAIVQGVRAALF